MKICLLINARLQDYVSLIPKISVELKCMVNDFLVIESQWSGHRLIVRIIRKNSNNEGFDLQSILIGIVDNLVLERPLHWINLVDKFESVLRQFFKISFEFFELTLCGIIGNQILEWILEIAHADPFGISLNIKVPRAKQGAVDLKMNWKTITLLWLSYNELTRKIPNGQMMMIKIEIEYLPFSSRQNCIV